MPMLQCSIISIEIYFVIISITQIISSKISHDPRSSKGCTHLCLFAERLRLTKWLVKRLSNDSFENRLIKRNSLGKYRSPIFLLFSTFPFSLSLPLPLFLPYLTKINRTSSRFYDRVARSSCSLDRDRLRFFQREKV